MIGAASVVLALAASAAANPPPPADKRRPAMRENPTAAATYQPTTFSALAGWETDDHAAAFGAFLKSCAKVSADSANRVATSASGGGDLASVCATAKSLAAAGVSRAEARAFFEQHFVPHAVDHGAGAGLVTGYYEPVLAGSRMKGGRFTTPVLRRPPDLVNLVDETERGAKADRPTHARMLGQGRTAPYPTRQEIDEGALDGMGLEILYLASPVDLFFMQVQGSGRIALDDGATVRLTYDGKNGHPYTSVGRHLIDTGVFAAEQVSLQSLEKWLAADAERGRRAMWQNRSYVFFRELPANEADGPLGAQSVPLTAGRSLAVDTAYHALGLPVWVDAPTLTHAGTASGLRRLMVAQDVGSAIRGPERGDIYFGSGETAGRIAGVTKHPVRFTVLLPRAAATAPASPWMTGQR
jgi:membrane-bound lytic murein transglycosylase A